MDTDITNVLADLQDPTIWDALFTKLIGWGEQLFYAVLVLMVSWFLVGMAMKVLDKALSTLKIDSIVKGYVKVCVKSLMYVLIAIIVLSMIGVPVTSLIAMLSAASVAIALALQGYLSNLAAGIVIIMNKPFVQGDFIENSGLSGKVEEIHLLNTFLVTMDNKKIIIPNSSLTSDTIVNYSTMEERRVDTVVSIDYNDDVELAKQVLRGIAADNELIGNAPAPVVGVSAHNASSIDIDFRVWCKNSDYWTVYYYVREEILYRFREAGLSIPFPQMDVHIKEQNKEA